MTEKIYLLDSSEQLSEMEAQDYDREDFLQKLLETHPDLLAGYQINEREPRRWLLVAREMSVPDSEGGGNRWSVDHLFLDQDGIPTLVEVKRASDTRIRREVVGQMFDYAANALVHWPVETIRHTLESTCAANEIDSTEAVCKLLELPLADNDEVEKFWGLVEDNLSLARLRLIFLADKIPVELKRIIEFLNEQMPKVEVLGVELRQYVGSELTALVPRVIGQTTAAESVKRKHERGRQWDEPSFATELANQGDPGDVEVFYTLLNWVRGNNLREWWGKGKINGSFIPVYDHPSGQAYSLFAVWTKGNIELYFSYHMDWPPFDSRELRLKFLHRINEIPGVNLYDADVDRLPKVKLSTFQDHRNMKQLQAAFEWFLAELNRTSADEE